MVTAVGCVAKTGWAVLVTLAVTSDEPEVVDRRRVELVVAPTERFAYHAAAGHGGLPPLSVADAEVAIAAVVAEAGALAADAATAVVAETGAHLAVVLATSGRPLGDLASTLANHTALHTAEGALYRGALKGGFAAAGVEVVDVPAKGVVAQLAARLGAEPAVVQEHLAALGKPLGPPWRADHRDAAAGAWLGLLGAAE